MLLVIVGPLVWMTLIYLCKNNRQINNKKATDSCSYIKLSWFDLLYRLNDPPFQIFS